LTVPAADIVCLSHLPWDFVFQRPNHLMARAAKGHRVFYVEEPTRGDRAKLDTSVRDGITIVRPMVPDSADDALATNMLRGLIDAFVVRQRIRRPWLWYYTPMAVRWTTQMSASAVVYDCMDELTAFRFAPAQLRDLERQLVARADVVFTGGRSLYEAKRALHPRTFCFPSSVDGAHFARARQRLDERSDQHGIGHPRIGYCGVIDERVDLELVDEIARERPDWQLVMLGPVAKIDPELLPRRPNIHWLGLKAYAELPSYLAGWDVALMPFALNESTRFISPTKTPEYLCAGKPVVSTSITDVVRPYGEQGLVFIADGAAQFVAAIATALECDRAELTARADAFLANQSWDATWSSMETLVGDTTSEPSASAAPIPSRRAGAGTVALAGRPHQR
jgi:UDP-galactopyranose mutase